VSYRILTTPLPVAPRLPVPRVGGPAAGLAEAFVRAAGVEPLLERLRDPSTVVVTTGQQPGLFTGPMYTVHKALSAAALARRLERRWGRPVVPVFWSAGDDHDWTEARHATWLGADGALHAGALPALPADAPTPPLYRVVLDGAIEPLATRIRADLGPAEFHAETADWLARHFVPGATFAGAYGAALAELLAPAGVLVLDSTHPAVKRAAVPVLATAIAEASDLDAVLAERAAELADAGAPDPGVAVGDGATLVMLEGALGRDRLVADADGRLTTRRSGERFAVRELLGLLEADPTRFSANVLLRPVVESAILPTVAYVAGPGELRYLPLAAPLYERLGVPRQLPVPRWSGVVLERRVERTLEKFGLGLDDVLSAGASLESRAAREMLPRDAIASLARIGESLEREYAALAAAADGIDPTLRRTMERLRNESLVRAREAERRLVRQLRKRRAVELEQFSRAAAALRPHGQPQERILTAATYLARHGRGLLEAISTAAERWYADALDGVALPA
jgi:bacillithiol biosynthesis cysteine-adding enzyme BshC